MSYNVEFLKDSLDDLGISYDDIAIDRLLMFYDLLLEWNEKINLTSITEFSDVVIKHFVDSLAVLKYFDISKSCRIIDIGTGAGFPGIPIKIIRPDIDFLLVDSLNKRIHFLEEVINKLELDSIEAIHGRAEELGHDPLYREQFDLCLSRAVADLSVLCEYSLPFVRPDGLFISYKSGDIDQELSSSSSAISSLAGHLDRIERFTISGTDISRSFVSIRKINVLDKRFPRNASRIKKNPL